ncbi:reverse transcriptase domain-containing protein [Tanacetum coccineum]
MAEYSQKWHNGTSRSRSTENSDGLTAIQAQLNNLGREIKKVNEKVYAAQVGCEQCKLPHYTKDYPLKEEGKTLEEAYYTQFGGPFQGGGYRAAAPGFYQRNNVNPSYQERRNLSFDGCCHSKPRSIDENFRNSNWANEQGASVSVMPLSTYLNLGLGKLAHPKLTVELADKTVKYPKGIAENILVGIGKFVFPVDFEILDMSEDIKVPLILGRPFLSTARAKIDVYKRKITLRVGEERIVSTRVIEEFRIRDDELDTEIDDYPSYCDYDKKIHIDYAHNLKFSCMIGFEFTHANFFPLLYVNVMSKEFHNSIMKDKMVYKGHNVIGALMNVPIFVGTFSVVTDFAILENMDAYLDEGMSDVIFGEHF